MHQTNQPPKFTDIQKNRLYELGLADEQVIRLEQEALIHGRIAFLPKAGMAEVREELRSLKGSVAKASKSLTRMSSLETTNLARHEAITRIRVADFQLYVGPNRSDTWENGCVQNSLRSMSHLLTVIDSALKSLPEKKRQSPSGAHFIAQIDHCLTRGFDAYHQRINPGRPPAFEIRVSATEGSQFHSIASICYEAIGHHADPRGAIETYLRETHRHKTRQVKHLYGAEIPPRQKGRPRKHQRTPPKN